MRRRLLLAFTLCGITSLAAFAEPLPLFEFDANFAPSFIPHSQVTLRSAGDTATLLIRIERKETSVRIERCVAERFLRDVARIKITPANDEMGLDGCTVELRLRLGSRQILDSDVWSPSPNTAPTESAILRALYKVTTASPIPKEQAKYLEELYTYFPGVSPFWKVSVRSDSFVSIAWPALFIVIRTLAWWSIGLSLLIGWSSLRFLTDFGWLKSVLVSVAMKAASIGGGGLLVTLAGLGWACLVGDSLDRLFPSSWLDPVTWMATLFIAVLVNAGLETSILRYGFKQRPAGRLLGWLMIANAFAMGIVSGSLIVSPPQA